MRYTFAGSVISSLVIVFTILISSYGSAEGSSLNTNSNDSVREIIKQEIRNLLTFDTSPVYSGELLDQRRDWIVRDYIERDYYIQSPDVVSVEYTANAEAFNSTLWLAWPFREQPAPYVTYVSYGMLIDADFDNRTGFRGFDYMYNIRWSNETKNWSEVIEKLSSTGQTITLYNSSAHNDFSEKHGYYVKMSLDLSLITVGSKYSIAFFADSRLYGSLVTDFTRAIAIPIPKLETSISPSRLVVRLGEEKTVELSINSRFGYTPSVNITSDGPEYINTTLPTEIRIPENGFGTLPIGVKVLSNAVTGPVRLPIYLNSSVATDQHTMPTYFQNKTVLQIPHATYVDQAFLDLTILPPLSFTEQFGNIISTISLIIFVIIPTIFSLRPSFLTRWLPDIISLERTELLQINIAIIAGVLIFLSLEGFSQSQQAEISLITANIIFPFAISTVGSLINYQKFAMRLTVAGFINLTISIILIAVMRL